MKKLLLFLLLIVPVFVTAKTCDNSQIYISSITADNQELEVKPATTNDKTANINLKMTNLGDTIKYKIIIENKSNDDYDLDNSINIKSNYIDYSIKSEDNSKTIKAKTSKTLILKVEYKKQIPENLFNNGKYNVNKNISFNILPQKNEININPSTGSKSMIIVIILLILLLEGALIIAKRGKAIKLSILLIGTILLIPISINAICKTQIKISSNIVIDDIATFNVEDDGTITTMKFRKGMTWADFLNSEYNIKNWKETEYYAIFHNKENSPEGKSERYYYFEDNKKGIEAKRYNWACNSYSYIENVYHIISQGVEEETTDMKIKNGFTYHIVASLWC